ncbi:uncharacterized protein LOC18423120 [Amborella trichopoda]|uniref:Lon N-terminal domain-containing protein n=1 Tax=Amborella trichopoda TaxID=13333 RepID=W1NJA1_AMBTC|nr:uncharacterized protein LOC18423120 [Amborella trichopoda]ERM95235.1 hypothetical protein AMTR_s00009p00268340 [Amborella trichopoda]|eukprot:XP_006827819.1 uncharacterized protein LOC18423120 [Amborella trichopoda]
MALHHMIHPPGLSCNKGFMLPKTHFLTATTTTTTTTTTKLGFTDRPLLFNNTPNFQNQRTPTIHQQYHVLRCSSSSERHRTEVPESSSGLVELPLFPLPLVLFPGAILPLQIFEFRYRMMMHTLLETDLRFGIIYADSTSGVVDVGCVGEVVKHERLVDDRFFLICKGQERFRVVNLVRTKPYLVAEVQWLEDRPPEDQQEDLKALASEVETYMKDVIRLSNRLNGKPEKEAQDLRRNLFPTPFSFFVGSTFEGAPREQQALLELEDTATRLKREKETLRNTLNYLTAASAVKDAFPSSS